MADKKRASLEEAETACRYIGEAIKDTLPQGWSFVVLLASDGAAGFGTYISSIKREDTIKFLREMADKIESNEDTV